MQKYADPLYAESELFVSEAVQLQLVISKEKELKEALDNFEKLKMLKVVLDSQAFQGITQKCSESCIITSEVYFCFTDASKLDGNLSKLVVHQDNQQKEASQLMDNTYNLTNNYSNFVIMQY